MARKMKDTDSEDEIRVRTWTACIRVLWLVNHVILGSFQGIRSRQQRLHFGCRASPCDDIDW